MELLFWLSTLTILYVFFGYPILLFAMAGISGLHLRQDEEKRSVTFVVPAYNEEKVIGDKIDNLKGLKYPGAEIIVASDGSSDKTLEIALDKLPKKCVIDEQSRRGKTNIINKSVALAKNDIIIFSDANVMLDEKAAEKLVAPFADETVGCVAGRLEHTNEGETDTAKSVSLFRRYEDSIKINETRTGSMIGADGSLFAIRRDLFVELPDYVIDDFSTSMGILCRGHRVVYQPDAIGLEKAPTEAQDEFKRKIRITNRVMTATMYLFPQLKNLSGWNWFKFLSHRLLRYCTVYFMALSFLTNMVLSNHGVIYALLFLGQIGFYGAFAADYYGIIKNKTAKLSKLLASVTYFVTANAAAGIGVFKALSGNKVAFWQAAESTR